MLCRRQRDRHFRGPWQLLLQRRILERGGLSVEVDGFNRGREARLFGRVDIAS
jgi:hypothetical protein